MKILKRILCSILSVAVILSTAVFATSYTDIPENSEYYTAVEALTQIGIFDGYMDGTFKPEQTVTRAEMAKLISEMQGINNAGSSTTQFSDVPSSHWASGYIANATGAAINGYPDGTFGPEDTIKYEQAVKMIMGALGYTVIANSNGGYPMGYMAAATKEGITDGINCGIGMDASRGVIAQLIYNALDTPLVEQHTWETDGSGEYIKYDGTDAPLKTLLSENLDIVKMRGIVTANSYANIYNGPVAIDKDAKETVTITTDYFYGVADTELILGDSETFLVGNTNANDYIGKCVDYYAQKDDYDNWVLISIALNSTYNKNKIVAFEDISIENDTIYYYKNNSSVGTKINIEDNCIVMYNNVPTTNSVYDIIENLKENKYSGNISFYDTNKTNGYDMIYIEAAVSGVVEDIHNDVIILKEAVALPGGGSISKINTNDDDTIVNISTNDVVEGDILSIIALSNSVYISADICNNTIEGVITSRKSSDSSTSGYSYKIDGVYYDIAAGANIDNLKVGDTGIFYIDKFNKIAYYDKTAAGSAGNYAYVIATLLDEDSWGNQTMEIKLLTKEGVKTYTTTDKFNIDDTTYTVKELDADPVASLIGNVVDISMSNKYIKKIITAGYDEEEFDILGNAISNEEYSAEDFEIGRTSFEEDTIVFYIEKDGDIIKESKSYIGTLADLEDKAIVSGQAYVDNKANADANILVLENAVTSTSSSTNIAIIVDIEDATNEDEEDIYTLTVLYNGEEVTLNTDADVYDDMYTGLTIGDIVKIKVNGNNIITSLTSVYNFDEDVRAKNTAVTGIANIGDADDIEYFVAGYADEYASTSKKITIGSDSFKLSNCDNVYVIDNSGREINLFVGTAADFYWDKYLVDKTTVTIDDDDSYTPEDVMDFVIVRIYDNDEAEAVIIKGFEYKDAE